MSKIVSNCIFLLASSLALTGCTFSLGSSSSSSASTGSEKSSESAPSSAPASASSSLGSVDSIDPEVGFESIWNYQSDIKIKLSFSDQTLYDLSRLQTNGGNSRYYDVYFPCTFEMWMNGKYFAFEEVGARMKGNTSRADLCDSNGNISKVCHFKLNFKATFSGSEYDIDDQVRKYKKDWSADATGLAERKSRSLFGLYKLDLKYLPRNSSSCNAQEIYVYDAFRSQGILAPHANAAKVTIATDSSSKESTYELVETIDKDFLKRNYSKAEAKGDLYKCVYSGKGPADFTRDGAVEKTYDSDGLTIGGRVNDGKIGCEDNINNYHPSYQLKTNDDLGNDSSFETMSNLINTLWNVTNKNGSKESLESVIDVEQFLKFSAISQLFGNPDDQRYNANNFYLYFLPSTKKTVFIPYDWDWCLGLDYGSHNMADRGAFDEEMFVGSYNPLFKATFFNNSNLAFSNEDYRNTYSSYIGDALDAGLLDYDNYVALANKLIYVSHSEYSTVQNYMSKKTSTLRG